MFSNRAHLCPIHLRRQLLARLIQAGRVGEPPGLFFPRLRKVVPSASRTLPSLQLLHWHCSTAPIPAWTWWPQPAHHTQAQPRCATAHTCPPCPPGPFQQPQLVSSSLAPAGHQPITRLELSVPSKPFPFCFSPGCHAISCILHRHRKDTEEQPPQDLPSAWPPAKLGH